MPEDASAAYEAVLTEWYARRALVDAYHRSLRFLLAHNSDAPQQEELVKKLCAALTALRQSDDQMRRDEQVHVAQDRK